MRLLRLELNGFKSFADRTVFEFEPGVTAFVGPNGCGKSNVVDAVRWILGERSAKAVRGSCMQDIIFNGAASRKPKAFAEATLTILNDRGILPVDFDEVAVTRRLYRTNESEYLLNRRPCRLRDIQDLFMDTGVGMHTYSIIEQGRVARLLEASPLERRVIFEEAAGISKYRSQLNSARAKLERTQQNLERAQIVLDQQEARLRSIRSQAAKARRWQEARARLKDIDVRLALRDYRGARDARDKLRQRIHEIEQRESELATQLVAAEGALVELGRKADDLDATHLTRQEELRSAETGLMGSQERVRRNTELLSEYDDATRQARAEIERLEARLSLARRELGEATCEYREISDLVETQTAAVEEQGRQAATLAGECERLCNDIERWKTEVIEVRVRAVGLRNEINGILQARQQDDARRGRLDERLCAADEAIEELDRADQSVRERQHALEARAEESNALLLRTERERLEALGLVAAAETDLRSLREREAALRERREVLTELDAAAEDVADGAVWLCGADSPVAGLIGMLPDIARPDTKYAGAIESVLGDLAQCVVFHTSRAALDALRLLREERVGRAIVLALDRLRPTRSPVDLAGKPGVIGRACDLLGVEPRFDIVAQSLLGDVWVVDSFETAVPLANNGAGAARLVTLDGDLFEPHGAVAGGAPVRGGGILSRRSELERIAEDLQRIAREIASRETERSRASGQAADLADRIANLRQALEDTRHERHVLDSDIQDNERQRVRRQAERRMIEIEVQEIQDSLTSCAEREQQNRCDLEGSEAKRRGLEEDIVASQARLEGQKAGAARLREQFEELRLTLARREVTCKNLEDRVRSLENAVTEFEERLAGARDRIETYAAKRRESESEIARGREDGARLSERRAELLRDLERISAERQAARQSRDIEMERGQTLRAGHDEVARRLSDLRVDESRRSQRMQGVEERLMADWELSVAEMSAEPPEAEGAGEETDWDALSAEAEELRRKIQRMSGVNTDALGELEELEAETQWRHEQRDDLENARKKLLQIIRKINRVCRERFREAFDQVRLNFQELFRKLFGGGSGDLRLIQEEGQDILDAGIDIIARPPGKQPEAIIQLSGGEKTLATVALVFAIFKLKPSPFCILDEVDAALDEANIDRFCAMVKDFLDLSQFIVITHSKRTMGLADTLYGITMMEQGVSSKLAVRMEEAERLADLPAQAEETSPAPQLVATS